MQVLACKKRMAAGPKERYGTGNCREAKAEEGEERGPRQWFALSRSLVVLIFVAHTNQHDCGISRHELQDLAPSIPSPGPTTILVGLIRDDTGDTCGPPCHGQGASSRSSPG